MSDARMQLKMSLVCGGDRIAGLVFWADLKFCFRYTKEKKRNGFVKRRLMLLSKSRSPFFAVLKQFSQNNNNKGTHSNTS
jgi:hypothetical protein